MPLTKPVVTIVTHKSHGYDEVDAPDTHVVSPALPAFVIQPEERKSGKFYYGVRIVTGSQKDASANPMDVYFSMTGTKGSSGEISIGRTDGLLGWFKQNFEKSTFDDLIIESSEDFGEIEVVGVGLHYDIIPEGLQSHWYVEFVTIVDFQDDNMETNFPCYHWIGHTTKEVKVTSKTTTLKDVAENPVLIQQRQQQLDDRKVGYQWKMYPDSGIPSSIDSDDPLLLPLDEEFERAKMVNFLGNLAKGKINSFLDSWMVDFNNLIARVLGMTVNESMSVQNLHMFENLALTLLVDELKSETPPKEVGLDAEIKIYEAYRWVADEEFGRQILNGVNPVLIRRCSALPENFHVTEDMVKPSLTRGLSFKEEMEGGHVYICDLSTYMDGLPCRDGYYCPAPICLLYVNTANKLVPIAIQLKKDPGDDNPIFLPTDHWIDWLTAKIYYRSADAQFHQIATHYIPCHAAMEAYCMATMRNIPDAHPLYKLLRPHYRYTMAINSAARGALINKGGIIDHAFAIGGDGKDILFQRTATKYRVQWTNIKENVKERGVDDPNLLPGYRYRDDGIRVWKTIESYVSQILDLYYKSDDDVKNDTELQNWVEEVHTTAFPGFHDAPQGHGFPDKLETKKDLVDYCTLIIFTGSAQHAAVNFGQFDIYAYVPNAPFGMRKAPPTVKGQTNYKGLLDSLPDVTTTATSIMVVYGLSRYSPDEIYLGGYPKYWFSEKEAQDITATFCKNLDELDDAFKKENEELDMPYIYLLPSRVPNSITI